MDLPADYHLHTSRCRHAVGEPRDYVARALEVGLPEVGFSDHSPMPQDDYDDWRMRQSELEAYVESVRAAQRDFPQIPIRLALEIDFVPGHEEWIRELAGRYSWDYLIGSVHYVAERWDVDNPAKQAEWSRRDADEVWTTYFERLEQAANLGCFDFLGHVDLPKKFRHYPRLDCGGLFRAVLQTARRRGVAIELNTAGLRKECREIYPSRELLQLAFAEQVPITFGSDAHAPGEVGQDLAEAVALAHSVGYRQACRFAQRQRRMAIL